MRKNSLILLFVLLVLMGGVVFLRSVQPDLPAAEVLARGAAPILSTPAPTSAAAGPTSEATPAPTPEPMPEPTPEPTPTPTPEPTPQLFTVSVIGDLTLASTARFRDTQYGYAARMNGDYSYPFRNTVQYFASDDFTISNLECTFTDRSLSSGEMFSFRSPTDYAQILTAGGVDFVTTANNHMLDFGQEALQDTWTALEAVGVPYGKENDSRLVMTPAGLVIGVYTAYNDYHPDKNRAASAIQSLREQGAEYVICAFHWGQELYYSPNAYQIELAHTCIDAGADLIYGTHTHCLQPIEVYGKGVILYSMGNWSFGGNTAPKDKDTAIVQIRVKRDLDGTISNDGINIVPCCVSSRPVLEGYSGDNYNDYVPTPYTVGSEAYNRVLSKLDGTYNATSQGADYSAYYASLG